MRLILSVWWAAVGVMLTTQAFTDWAPALSTAELPDELAAAAGATMAAGAVLALVGLTPDRLASRSWRQQRAGVILAGAAWAAYAFAAVVMHPAAVYHPLSSLVQVALAAVWLRRLHVEETRVRALVDVRDGANE